MATCAKFWVSLLVIKCVAGKDIPVGLLLPYDANYSYSMTQVKPAVQMAIAKVNEEKLASLNLTIKLVARDSQRSEVHGPLAAIDIYRSVYLFLGPVYGYSIAPVSRYAAYWNIPVITAGALETSFSEKSEYKTLTRVGLQYSEAATVFKHILIKYNWTNVALIYHGNPEGTPRSVCYMLMWPMLEMIIEYTGKPDVAFKRKFDENTEFNATKLLVEASLSARSKFVVFNL